MKRLLAIPIPISILFSLLMSLPAFGFDIDFSRRQKNPVPAPRPESNDSIGNNQPVDVVPQENINGGHVVPAESATEVVPAQDATNYSNAAQEAKTPSRFDGLIKRVISPANADRQEFVILNTSTGFIPSNVRLRKGFHYTVHVVNVNEDKKNVSFMLDAFQQHHATYFGKIRSFDLDPNREGIFEFQCPETAALGKIVVFGDQLKVERHLSSER